MGLWQKGLTLTTPDLLRYLKMGGWREREIMFNDSYFCCNLLRAIALTIAKKL